MFPEHGDDPELLIGRAGAAMHAGKDEGGGQIIYYEPGMQDRANRALVIEAQLHQALDSGRFEVFYALVIEAQLHQALDSGRFEVFYQPLIEVSTLKVTGVEALARLRDADGSYIPPDEFISVAERIGLIAEMGYQQLYKACVQLEQCKRQTISPIAFF